MKRDVIWVICGVVLIGALTAWGTGCARPASESGSPGSASAVGKQVAGPVPPSTAPQPETGKGSADLCLSNLKQLAVAFVMYKEDYDGCFPPADRWSDVLPPYVKDQQVFKCPADPKHEYGYAFNRAVAGKRVTDIPNWARTPLVFDSTIGKKDAADYGESWPTPPRHKDMNNCAFVDGHAERLREKPEFEPK